VVAKPEDPLAIRSVLNAEPALLIQKKHMQIVKERSCEAFTENIIPSAGNDQSVVDRQEVHSVADSRTWRFPKLLDSRPFHSIDFAVFNIRLNELEIILYQT
jgi:hypothetical protein